MSKANICNAHGIQDCQCYEADLEKRIKELKAENERLEAERERPIKCYSCGNTEAFVYIQGVEDE